MRPNVSSMIKEFNMMNREKLHQQAFVFGTWIRENV